MSQVACSQGLWVDSMSKPKRLPTTLRLTSPAAKQEYVDRAKKNLKKILNTIGESSEELETKEELANFILFLLNVVDIENERLRFDKIKTETSTGLRRKLL